MSLEPENRPYRRCFVSGSDPLSTARLTDMIRANGIEAGSADDIRIGRTISKEITSLIRRSDFVAAVIVGETPATVAYELGVAQGLGKPVFIVFVGGHDLDLANAYTVTIQNIATLDAVAEDIKRFARNARNLPSDAAFDGHAAPRLEWAREKLHELRASRGEGRGLQFEQLCSAIFVDVGGEVVDVGAIRDVGADMVVWLNRIVFEIGGPILVECKFYGGGVGSVIKNSQASVHRLDKALDRSDARLGLLIYDHDRPAPPATPYETPRVISFPIEDLIDAAEKGMLEQVILKRRERALFTRAGQ